MITEKEDKFMLKFPFDYTGTLKNTSVYIRSTFIYCWLKVIWRNIAVKKNVWQRYGKLISRSVHLCRSGTAHYKVLSQRNCDRKNVPYDGALRKSISNWFQPLFIFYHLVGVYNSNYCYKSRKISLNFNVWGKYGMWCIIVFNTLEVIRYTVRRRFSDSAAERGFRYNYS